MGGTGHGAAIHDVLPRGLSERIHDRGNKRPLLTMGFGTIIGEILGGPQLGLLEDMGGGYDIHHIAPNPILGAVLLVRGCSPIEYLGKPVSVYSLSPDDWSVIAAGFGPVSMGRIFVYGLAQDLCVAYQSFIKCCPLGVEKCDLSEMLERFLPKLDQIQCPREGESAGFVVRGVVKALGTPERVSEYAIAAIESVVGVGYETGDEVCIVEVSESAIVL
ncbi:unnamed protein product [Lepeophtheirus salmonis]|uniref:(salmon louse) hypothetical protein n=1 Tax=Lepeophtheirus salmonis TaxID=72036 RepID=A0A7R8CVW2_LEPSM|nr:unnamed protein product [Lepeophtheirus salmonis]CAF2897743.1 unnamed protein product [Lepeophtheirus salmonis]